ncbi:hypothetical protein NBRC10512_006586 [Rhodotorula toruloides]|uniref:RHTO0S10e05336g1_1 n=2 Tax=Rhodotorula toruloides TaxID=5286 RepID=A0A061B5C0_RHOTO|nr:uncharacterized protein RHTO_08118 [Rhodotorula toruloides NP11]EMS22765.1 hypothetical protein RHTO_08118 [Rhodotorula toruloides NP11]CDR45132.1 RHTO0S10e05336g1_1 [Rhodotorula toruloides]
MPRPTHTHTAQTPRQSTPTSSSSSNTSGHAPTARRRKGVPVKSPGRSLAPSTLSSSTPAGPRTLSSTVNAPHLLKVLLRDSDLPRSSLDNKRFKPAAEKAKKKKTSQRDTLPPALEGYGRGRRGTSLSAITSAEGDYDLSGAYAAMGRGRSPGVHTAGGRKGKANGVHHHHLSSSARRTHAPAHFHPYAHTSSPSYQPSTSAIPYADPSRMARALSAGLAHAMPPASIAPPHLAHPPQPYYPPIPPSSAVPVPSPLARSFSASGAERLARQRTPSGSTGVARVAELAGTPVPGYHAVAA